MRDSLPETKARVAGFKSRARALGRDMDVYTVGVVTCRPTVAEARAYHQHAVVEMADWSAVDGILAKKNISPATVGEAEHKRQRAHYANGMGGYPLVGDPDKVAAELKDLADAGLGGIAVSFVNYLDELPYFVAEVLPRLARLGLRG